MNRNQRRRPSHGLNRSLFPAIALAAAGISPLAMAAADQYAAPSGNWSTGGNWSLGHAPSAGDGALLVGNGSPDVITFDSAATGTGLSSVTLEAASGGSVVLTIPASATNALTVNGAFNVGVNSTGQVTQNGGFVSALSYGLAYNGGAGTYTLNSGTMVSSLSDFNVGRAGQGAFTMSGGTFSGPNFLIGTLFGASGTVTISGGVATATNVWVGGYYGGAGGNGVLTVSGSGQLNVPGTLTVYNDASSVFFLAGGTVTTGALSFSGNLSRFQWLSGTLNVTGTSGLSIADGGVNGSFWQIIASNETLNVTNALTIGPNAGGAMAQSGGAVSAGSLNLGTSTASHATYALNGDTATFGSAVIGASSGSGTNAFNITGGSLNITGQLSLGLTGQLTQTGGSVSIGSLIGLGGTSAAGTPGSFTLSGVNQIVGTSTNPILFVGGSQTFAASGTGLATLGAGGVLNTGTTVLGAGGFGTFLQTGGTHNVKNLLVGLLGNSGAYTLSGGTLNASAIDLGDVITSTGTFNLTGGQLVLNSGTTYVGFGGTGVLNQSGGVHTTGALYLGYVGNATGVYNMSNGATLNVTGTEGLGFSGARGTAFNQYGGVQSVGGDVNVHAGNYLLADGSFNVGGNLHLEGGPNPVSFTQTAGLLSVNASDGFTSLWGYQTTANFNQSGGTHQTSILAIAYSPGTVGTYSLINGSLVLNSSLGIGVANVNGSFQSGGAGTFTQYGGATTVGTGSAEGAVYVGGTVTNASSSSFNLYGGKFSIRNNGTFFLGFAGPGYATLSGNALLSIDGALGIGLGGRTGCFTQTGGTNVVTNISVGSTGSYVMTGGTLSATTVATLGSYLQTGGSANLGTVTGGSGASMYVGGAGTAQVTLKSINSVATMIADQGLITIIPVTNATSISNSFPSLAIQGSGKLDVGNSSFLTNSNVQPYLAAGFHNGAWNGTGAAIVSTSANTAPGTAARSLGFASDADQAAGRVAAGNPTLAAGQTLVKYTTPGDADLSGVSNFNDFLAMQNNFNKAGNWTQGDFDYNGTTNFNDFLILQNNFNRGLNANGTTAGGTVAHSAVSKLTASPAAVTPSVTYILSKNDDGKGNLTPGKYAVYAVDSSADGNQGVASFSVDVQGASLVTNFAPQGTFDKGQGNGSTVVEGFTLLRSVSGAFSTGTDPVKGSQDTVDDQSGVVLIYGMGQVAGNLNTKAPSGSTGGSAKVQASYGSPLLISTGTFASGLAFNSDQTFDKANVFLTNTAADTEAAGITLVTQDLSVGVPEPTALSLVALGAGSLLGRRKRRK